MGEIARSKSRIASDLKTRDSNRWRPCDLKLRFETRDWRFILNTGMQQNCEKGCDLSPRSRISRAAKRGCFKRGGFPIWTCPSFFVLFCPFGTFPGIFPICSGTLRGFSRLVLFLFLGLLRAPTRNSPERVRDTIWTFPEKSGKHPGLETPRFSFSQRIASDWRLAILPVRVKCPKW